MFFPAQTLASDFYIRLKFENHVARANFFAWEPPSRSTSVRFCRGTSLGSVRPGFASGFAGCVCWCFWLCAEPRGLCEPSCSQNTSGSYITTGKRADEKQPGCEDRTQPGDERTQPQDERTQPGMPAHTKRRGKARPPRRPYCRIRRRMPAYSITSSVSRIAMETKLATTAPARSA